MNFTADNQTLTVDAGASIVGSDAVPGRSYEKMIGVRGAGIATWTLINNGSITNTLDADLVGRSAGPGLSIIRNTGIIQNDTATNRPVIGMTNNNTSVDLVNSGTILGNGGPAVWSDGSGTTTIVNQAGGRLQSRRNWTIYQNAITSLSVTNEAGGTIESLNTSNGAVYSGGQTVIRNAGTIASGGGMTQYAIFLGGRDDTVILEPTSVINGLVYGGSGNDILALGGNGGNGTFDLSQLGNAAQYRLFPIQQKRESSTWTLTGNASNQVQNWQLLEGTLQLASGASVLGGSFTNPVTATGPVTLRIAGAMTGAGAGITMAGPFTNALVLDTGAAFGSRTLINSGGTTVLTGPVAFPNAVTISGGTLQLGDGGAGTGGAVTGAITDNAALVFNRADDVTQGSVIGGTGTVTQAGSNTTTLTAVNTYSGGTAVNAGTLRVTGPGAIGPGAAAIAGGGTLFVDAPTAGNYTFGNALSGSGMLRAALIAPTNTFAFGTSAGTAFTGVVALGNSTFALSGTNAQALTNATLQLDTGNLTDVGTGTQAIGGVTLNGGTLSYSVAPAGLIAANTLTMNAGQVRIDPTTLGGGSLLAQDDGILHPLIRAGTVNGSSAGLSLADLSGNPLGGVSGVAISQGGNTVAVGTYSAGLGTGAGDGLYTTNQLTQLDLQASRTLSLSGDNVATSGADDMRARITGSGALQIDATNAITLNNSANDYTGATTANTGTLRLGSDAALGNTASLTISGGANVDLAGHSQRIGTLGGGGALQINGGTLDVVNGGAFDGAIAGAGGHLQLGGGTLALGGESTYTGATSVAAGATLRIGTGATVGSYAGNITDNGLVVFDRSDALSYGGALTGTGALTHAGTGTLVLTGANTHAGITTIDRGTLQIGDGGTIGSVAGNIVNNGTLAFDRADSLTQDGRVSGTGSLTQAGAGVLTLTAANTYTGITTVSAGTLRIDGDQSAATGAVNVGAGATLAGMGTTGGDVSVADGGHLAGMQGQTLTMHGLLLGASAQTDVSLAVPSTAGLFNVTGDLTLGGKLNVTSTGAFGPGVYRIIQYGGALTDSGMTLGTVPAGSTANVDLLLQTSIPNQINVVNAVGAGPLTFWDGDTPTQFNNGVVNGSSGTWRAGNDAWTNSAGAINAPWQMGGFAIFQGTAGTVSVDNGSGPVSFSGAQFAIDGYHLAGQSLTTDTADTIVRVGDGTQAGAAMNATIDAVIQGTGGLDKTDLGTLSLTAVNTYGGATSVSAGTLRLAGAGTLGAGAASIAGGATLLIDAPTSGSYTFGQSLTGTGTLRATLASPTDVFAFGTGVGGAFGGTVALGQGTFALSGTNAASLAGATLQLEAGNVTTVGTGTQTVGNLTLGGGTLTYGASVDNKVSAGTLTLTGGTVRIDPASTATTGNLLAQDEGVSRQLVQAGSVAGAATSIALADTTGAPLSAGTANIVQGGGTVAVGSYDYALTTGGTNDGLYAAVRLSQLNLQAGQTLSLSADAAAPAGADELHARVTGAGGLRIDATGVITLGNQANDYTGATHVATGTLRLGTDTALGQTTLLDVAGGAAADLNGKVQRVGMLSGAGALHVNGGTLTIADGGTFGGVIDGSAGGLNLSAGTLVLTGANSYTGATTIASGGILQLGAADTAGSYGGTIADNGQLIFNRSDDVVHAATIMGNGTLKQAGSGDLTLAGANTYAGGTTVASGTLTLQQGNGAGTGAIANAAALQLAFAADSTLANELSGAGTLHKSGAGTATLTAAGSTQGDVTVDAGTLRWAQTGAFNAANYTTASGATTAMAGDASLAVAGTLQQAAGASLHVAVGSAEPVISANTANLDGTLSVTGLATGAPNTASALTSTDFTILHTTGGITGNFSGVALDRASQVDYLVVGGKIVNGSDYNVGFDLAWTAGSALGNGNFTLSNAADTFNADVVLASQTGSFASGWDGKTLTKAGTGTLILSATNTYDGDTKIGAGTVRTAVANAFAASANVNVASGATLDLDSFNQRAANLSGAGSITLGSAFLDAAQTADTAFSGVISGSGGLVKSGAGSLTLSGANTYAAGTTILSGALIAPRAAALGSGAIDNAGTLQLSFAADETLANTLAGPGNLTKTGAGTALLTAGGTQGSVTVSEGTLKFGQTGAFNVTGDHITAAGATTALTAAATLDVIGNAALDGTLSDVAGPGQPAVSARAIALGAASIYSLSGYSAPAAATASELAFSRYTVLSAAQAGGLTGMFANVTLAGANSATDYLAVTSFYGPQTYEVGLALSWYAGASATPQVAHGTFTLAAAGGLFDLDAVLADQPANAALGWDGRTLTKAGEGTLQLSKSNTYTGATLINGGILRAGAADVIASSERVQVATGATFDLNGFAQRVNNLSGTGSVALAAAALTVANNADTEFAGSIGGTGSVRKTGGAKLTLSNDNTYTGGTTIEQGVLQLGNGGMAGSVTGDIVNQGSLVVDRGNTYAYDGVISGGGNLVKQGAGPLILSRTQTYTGPTDVGAGALILLNEARLASTQPVTVAPGATLGGYGGVMGSVVNQGLLAVADAAPGFASGPAGHFVVGGSLTNGGEIRMASPVPASTLTIQGDYIGNNGLLTLSTALGGDNSATDRMVVEGSTSGATRVAINNSGGTGAQTVNGIEVVHVRGTSAGAFALQGRVVAGPYEYRLTQGTPGGNDGNWYLTSTDTTPAPSPAPTPGPQLRPEAGTYLANQSAANALFVHTLHDRMGEPNFVDGSRNGRARLANGWVRLAGTSSDATAAGGKLAQSLRGGFAQFGGDMVRWQGDGQPSRVHMGVMGAAGRITSSSSVQGLANTAHGAVDAYSAGVYGTWYRNDDRQAGPYLDGWLQYGWYDNKTNGSMLPGVQYASHNWTGSLEGGYTALLGEGGQGRLYVQPQLQLIYSSYHQGDIVETNGTRVQTKDVGGWLTRLGVTVFGQSQLAGGQSVQPYAALNWWHAQNQPAVVMSGATVQDGTPRDRFETKFGAQARLTRNWHLWGDVGFQMGADSYSSVQGQLGVKYVW
ncbi:autotransporter outer membrane beta-barrel domain-containing protein [Cupriavidus plantarum]|uniref:autotransporter outer membrane beta-barrel domain-containing protein n=1 Tax=Cupriavidus plantarum TaxID=942865 RepID=UPI001BACCA4F|nr:autotransporter outer membrane beta-barrel domain-containing protein [Cupriavidus plantarum]